MDHVIFRTLQELFPNVMIISSIPNSLSNGLHFKGTNFDIFFKADGTDNMIHPAQFTVKYILPTVNFAYPTDTKEAAFDFIYQCLKEFTRHPSEAELKQSIDSNDYISDVNIDGFGELKDVVIDGAVTSKFLRYVTPIMFGNTLLAHVWEHKDNVCFILFNEEDRHVGDLEESAFVQDKYYFGKHPVEANTVYVTECRAGIRNTIANNKFDEEGWYMDDNGDIFTAFVLPQQSTERLKFGGKVYDTSIEAFVATYDKIVKTYTAIQKFNNGYTLYIVTFTDSDTVMNLLVHEGV